MRSVPSRVMSTRSQLRRKPRRLKCWKNSISHSIFMEEAGLSGEEGSYLPTWDESIIVPGAGLWGIWVKNLRRGIMRCYYIHLHSRLDFALLHTMYHQFSVWSERLRHASVSHTPAQCGCGPRDFHLLMLVVPAPRGPHTFLVPI